MENHIILSAFGLSEEYLKYGHVSDSIQLLKGLHKEFYAQVNPNAFLLELLIKLELRLSQIFFKYTNQLKEAKEHIDYCLILYKKLKKLRISSFEKQHICLQIYNLYTKICFTMGTTSGQDSKRQEMEDVQKYLNKALKYCNKFPQELRFEKEYFTVQTLKMYFYLSWIVPQNETLKNCFQLIEEAIQFHSSQISTHHLIWKSFYLSILLQIHLSFPNRDLPFTVTQLVQKFEQIEWKEVSTQMEDLEHQSMYTLRSMFYLLLSIYNLQIQDFQLMKKSMTQVQKHMGKVNKLVNSKQYQCIFDWISIPTLFSLSYLLTQCLYRSVGEIDKATKYMENTTNHITKRVDEIQQRTKNEKFVLDSDTSEELSSLLRLGHITNQEKTILSLCSGELLYAATNLNVIKQNLIKNTAVCKEFFYNIHLLIGSYFIATNELQSAKNHFLVVMKQCFDLEKQRWAKLQLVLLELLIFKQGEKNALFVEQVKKKKIREIFTLIDETNELLEKQPKNGSIRSKAIQATLSYVRGVLCELNATHVDAQRHIKDALTLVNSTDGPVSNYQLIIACMMELSKISFYSASAHTSTTYLDHASAALALKPANSIDLITFLPLYHLLGEYQKLNHQSECNHEITYLSKRSLFEERVKLAVQSSVHQELKEWLPGNLEYNYVAQHL